MMELIANVELIASVSFGDVSTQQIRNALLIAIGFATVIAVAEIWHQTSKPPVEWTRKLVHLGGGGLCLMLPLLINSFWIVLALAIGMCAIFVVSKRQGWLNSIHGVERSSHGTEFYPIVILLLFLLAGDRYWQYIICVLVLAVADSAAALIGTRYGSFRFTVENEKKSLEGSLAFLVVTFLVVFIPLVIWRPLGESADATTHYLLTATLLGLLVNCVEIVSLKGTDNLWVPLGSWLVLTKTFQTDAFDLAAQNISFSIILICLVLVSYSSNLINVGGSLVCCLAAYGLWAMGSLDWAAVFFIAFGFYIATAWLVKTPWQIRVRAAAYSLIPPMLVLAAANVFLNTGHPETYRFLFGPFLAASCVSLSQATANLASWKFRKEQPKRYLIGLTAAMIVSLTVVVVSMIRQNCFGWTGLITFSLVTALFVSLGVRLLPTLPPRDAPRNWLRIRSAISLAAAVCMWLVQVLGLTVGWMPG